MSIPPHPPPKHPAPLALLDYERDDSGNAERRARSSAYSDPPPRGAT